jgi:hypothetical protein
MRQTNPYLLFAQLRCGFGSFSLRATPDTTTSDRRSYRVLPRTGLDVFRRYRYVGHIRRFAVPRVTGHLAPASSRAFLCYARRLPIVRRFRNARHSLAVSRCASVSCVRSVVESRRARSGFACPSWRLFRKSSAFLQTQLCDLRWRRACAERPASCATVTACARLQVNRISPQVCAKAPRKPG